MNGGGFIDALFTRPFIATNPTTAQYDAQTAWKGQPIGPGPESWQRGYQYQLPHGTRASYIEMPGVYDRTLPNDIKTRG
jgi:hypothetical protein